MNIFWIQTSGTGRSDRKLISPKDYFNSISRNNQGEIDKIIYVNKTMKELMEEEE
tara:strand:+ start:257 stop:421 length:165 start_codon:yes stop_codon:yes gene_type:complete